MSETLAAPAAAVALLGLSTSVLSLLAAHAAAVAEASPRLGLVSTGDEGQILSRHTADSLLFALARAPRSQEHWVDAGSGAGFPGLVLAMCYPATTFTLIDSNTKKAGFLEVTALDLGLSNVKVLPQRMEMVKAEFDVATARAVDDPRSLLPSLLRLVIPGGDCIVASTGDVSGARVFRTEIPEVDSPGTLSIMSRPFNE